MAADGSETNGSGGEHPFDHNDLETLGRALREAGRGLVSFGADYPYLDAAEREIRRKRFGRVVALINSLWPRMDYAIKADPRAPIRSPDDRNRIPYQVDRLFNMMEAVVKKPPKDD